MASTTDAGAAPASPPVEDPLVASLFDAVPCGVVHVDAQGNIRHANAEALRVLGFRFDELTRRIVSDFAPETIHEDGSPCSPAEYPVSRALATGKPQPPCVIGVKQPAGETSWAVFRAVPMHAPTGELVGAVATFVDISERVRAEAQLRASEAKWRSLAQNVPDFITIVDHQAKITSINRVLSQFEGQSVIGSSATDYLDPEHVDEWKSSFAQAIETGNTVRIECPGIGDRGRTAWYESVFVPFVDDGAPRVLIVARDSTERRHMLASLAEKERLASVGMLAASVAHEIMNPLTYVLANLDFALDARTAADDRRQRALEEAREGAQRMRQIVRDLRSLGRAGTEELFYVDARGILETALRLTGPEVARSAAIVLELGEVPPVFASESRLCQVFINLLVNAAQAVASRDNGKPGEIRLRTRTDDARSLVGIEVIDSGVGIAAAGLSRIFDPFYTTKLSGTGLGLAISRDIVERMGGRIDVSSVVGEGTTFTVWLSTARPHPSSSATATSPAGAGDGDGSRVEQ